jgi:predicted enzyme related to lactoylglutathione lyase
VPARIDQEATSLPTDAMRLRMELFVEDLDRAIAFYRDALGFALLRRDNGYASVRRGDVTLGLGPIAKLPDVGGYFTRPRLRANRGLGVEIVLEVADVAAEEARVRAAGYSVVEPLRDRPWGLADFRLTDPDGYYLRITSLPARDVAAP